MKDGWMRRSGRIWVASLATAQPSSEETPISVCRGADSRLAQRAINFVARRHRRDPAIASFTPWRETCRWRAVDSPPAVTQIAHQVLARRVLTGEAARQV